MRSTGIWAAGSNCGRRRSRRHRRAGASRSPRSGAPPPLDPTGTDGARGGGAYLRTGASPPPPPRGGIAQPPQRRHQPDGVPVAAAVDAIRGHRVTFEPGFVAVVGDQPDPADEAGHDPDGERASTEAEPEEMIARPVVTTGEAIEIEDVPLEAEAEDAAENGQGLERGRADAVGVVGNLLVRMPKIERPVEAPDIGLEQLGGAVSGPVGQQHDVLRHAAW